MSVYEALLMSLDHRQPDAPTAVDYLAARGYERHAVQAAIRQALDRGDIRLGPRFTLERVP